jgi:hypothetical protein
MGRVFNATRWRLYPQQRESVRIVQVSVLVPRPVWMGAEYLARV